MDSPLLNTILSAARGNVALTVVLSVFFLTIAGLAVFIRGYPRPLPDIPYNKDAAKLWLGDIASFQNHFKETGEGWDWMSLQCEKLNSPIVQVFLGPWQKPAVILVDQVEIRDIITRRGKDFDRGGFLTNWLSSVVPHGTISMPSHDRFKTQRAAWQGTMTGDFVNRTFVPHMWRHTTQLIERWSIKAELAQGRPFEANADIRVNIFEIVWSAAFGNNLGLTGRNPPEFLKARVELFDNEARFPAPQDEGILKAMAYMIDTLDSTRSSPFPVLHHAFLRQSKQFRQMNKVKKTVIRELLDDSKARFDAKGSDMQVNCAMDYVYKRQLEKSHKIGIASDAEMEDELVVFLIGGFESSQHNTSWGLKYITREQSAQANLREELLSVFPGANSHNLPAAYNIATANLPYLDACLEEALRLSKTNAGALRIAVRDTQIYGYHIPKGTDLFGVHTGESAVISLPPRPSGWVGGARAGMKKGSWAKGTLSQYMPERWLSRSESGVWTFDINAGPSMSFGAGARGCFGQRLARTTLRMLFVMLVLSFEFEPVQGEMASFAADEKLVRMAKQCYVKIKVRH